MKKVMVEFAEGGRPLTYEVEGEVAVGDIVDAPYGFRNEVLKGRVVALGAHATKRSDGSWEPAYTGPCKTATVTFRTLPADGS